MGGQWLELQSYADDDIIELIALKACMVVQILLLQKLQRQSKAKGHSHTFSRLVSLVKWSNIVT